MALKYVDPTAKISAPAKAYHNFVRSSFGRWFAMNIASRVDAKLLNATRGKVGTGGPLPSATLETRGAKSGQMRENPVLYFHDGPDVSAPVTVIASSFGRDKHPAWYYNAKAHPDEVTVNGEPFHAEEITDAADRERLFNLATAMYAGYGDYKKRTDAIGRTIPVLQLTPRN